MNLSIGQVAAAAGIGIETVRFYERQGLIPPPARRASGYRQYDESAVARLQFIRRAKNLGFTLKEIQSLLDLRTSGDASDLKRQAGQKIAEIDAKIDSLKRIRRALTRLAEHCPGYGPLSDCPILDALEGRENRKKTHTKGARP